MFKSLTPLVEDVISRQCPLYAGEVPAADWPAVQRRLRGAWCALTTDTGYVVLSDHALPPGIPDARRYEWTFALPLLLECMAGLVSDRLTLSGCWARPRGTEQADFKLPSWVPA